MRLSQFTDLKENLRRMSTITCALRSLIAEDPTSIMNEETPVDFTEGHTYECNDRRDEPFSYLGSLPEFIESENPRRYTIDEDIQRGTRDHLETLLLQWDEHHKSESNEDGPDGRPILVSQDRNGGFEGVNPLLDLIAAYEHMNPGVDPERVASFRRALKKNAKRRASR